MGSFSMLEIGSYSRVMSPDLIGTSSLGRRKHSAFESPALSVVAPTS